MKVCVLSSGSQGNMTYVEGGNTKLLIDAGISLSNAQKRCQSLPLDKITDIIITHEHGDHVKFLDTISNKTNANIYMSKKSFFGLKPAFRDKFLGKRICFIEPESKYKVGDFDILTFKLNHDCCEVLGYIISYDGKTVGYFTDTGIMPDKYMKYLSNLDVLIIEANHNVEKLINSDRDYTLKNRILSPEGHISNQRCYEILSSILTKNNKYVILSHVSQDCNSEQCLYEDIINKLYNFEGKILIAKQNEALEVIEI